MKILQLAPRFPFPADDGGKIVMANTFCEFSKQNQDIILFSFNREKYIQESAILEAEKFGLVEIFNYNTKNTPLKIIKSILTNQPVYLQKYNNRQAINKIEEKVVEIQPDVIQVEHTCMAPLGLYFKKKYNIPVGLRLHNIESNIWASYADELSNPFSKIYIKKQAELLRRYELDIISQVDINFTITEKERKKILKLRPESNIITSSPGIYPDKWVPSDFSRRNLKQLILATTFDWIHNVNALKWFLDEVLPKVHKEEPEVKMLILGKNSPDWVKRYSNLGAISVGYVSDIQEYMRQSSIYVAPLFVGAGIRIKILEAMAMAMPVVATTISSDGITAKDTDGLYTIDDPQKYAEKIIELMKNPELCSSAGENARTYVVNNFSWELGVSIMIEAYKNILTKNNLI